MVDSVLSFISALIWPGVILYLVGFRYRSEIANVLNDFKAKTPWFSVEHTTQQESQQASDPLSAPPSQTHSPDAKGAPARLPLTIPDGRVVALAEQTIKAELENSHTSLNDQRDVLLYALASRYVELQFERIYILTFGSQLAALDALSAFPLGVDQSFFERYYNLAKQAWPTQYASYPIASWVTYLKNTGLVHEENSKYTVTDFGFAFMRYVILRQLSKEKAL